MKDFHAYKRNPYESKIERPTLIFDPSAEEQAIQREWGLRALAWDLAHDAAIARRYQVAYLAEQYRVGAGDVAALTARAAELRAELSEMEKCAIENTVEELSSASVLETLTAKEARWADDGASAEARARVAAEYGFRLPSSGPTSGVSSRSISLASRSRQQPPVASARARPSASSRSPKHSPSKGRSARTRQ